MLIERLWSRLRSRDRAMPAETKASRTGPLVALSAPGRAVWTPRDYASLAREGYSRNPVVFRCVRMISEAAASVPLVLFDGERELETGHRLIGLLKRPNPGQSGTALFETVYGHLLVSGNAYLEAVSIDGAVRELFALRPDRMRVVAGGDGWPEAYEYVLGARSVRFRRQEGELSPILHLTLFNPLDDHYGFAPLEAAQTSLDIHNASGAWNKALLDNAARPSGALVYTGGDGNLTDDQFDRLKRELEDGYQGARNAGRPLLLEGGLDWKPMALTPRDLDFIEAKNQAAREIALAFGVPPMLLGIPGDNTFANFREAQRAFWRQTVVPLVGRTGEAVSAWLGDAFGAALSIEPDLDRIEALSDERDALWARVTASTFLTEDEKRLAVGYGALPRRTVRRAGEAAALPASAPDGAGK